MDKGKFLDAFEADIFFDDQHIAICQPACSDRTCALVELPIAELANIRSIRARIKFQLQAQC